MDARSARRATTLRGGCEWRPGGGKGSPGPFPDACGDRSPLPDAVAAAWRQRAGGARARAVGAAATDGLSGGWHPLCEHPGGGRRGRWAGPPVRVRWG